MPAIRDLFDVEQEKEILILSPRGDVAGFLDQDIRRQVEDIEAKIDAVNVKHLLVDLSHSKYFGSVVIGIFNALAQFVRKKHGVMVLCHVSDDMSQVLRIMKFDDLLPQFETRKAGIKYLKKVEPSRIS